MVKNVSRLQLCTPHSCLQLWRHSAFELEVVAALCLRELAVVAALRLRELAFVAALRLRHCTCGGTPPSNANQIRLKCILAYPSVS